MLNNIPVELKEQGSYLVGIISMPGVFVAKGAVVSRVGAEKTVYAIEDKFKLRIACNGTQVHSPDFYTVTFRKELASEADRLPFLKKELAEIAVHGRGRSNVGKDGKTVYTELEADSVRELKKV